MNKWKIEWINVTKYSIDFIQKRKEKNIFFSIRIKKTVKTSKNEWIYEWESEWIHKKLMNFT